MKTKQPPPREAHSEVNLSQSLAYSLPNIAAFMLLAPVSIVQGIYAKYYGLALTTIAAVIVFVRLFDALSDPMIGYLSDRYRDRTGSYKPIIVSGGLLLIISGYFLYGPPDHVTTVYFSCWFILFYLGWTLFEIPHLAWGGELSGHSTGKTKIYSFRNAAGYSGLVLFYAIPLLPFFDTTEITPETLRWSAIAAGLLMLPLLYECIKRVPDHCGLVYINKPIDKNISVEKYQNGTQNLRLLLDFILHNKPFMIFLGLWTFSQIGIGLWYGLIFIYVDVYLDLGDQFAGIFLLAFVIGIIATPVWYKVAAWSGKKNAWLLATVLVAISFVYTGLLTPNTASFSDLVTIKVLNTLGFVCITILSPSMLSDIVDYATWKTGTHRTATYFSIFLFSGKAANALGVALGLAIAGGYGFDPTAPIHTESGVFGLRLAIAWLPLLFIGISAIFATFIPINAHRHAIIRRRLEVREVRILKANEGSASIPKTDAGLSFDSA